MIFLTLNYCYFKRINYQINNFLQQRPQMQETNRNFFAVSKIISKRKISEVVEHQGSEKDKNFVFQQKNFTKQKSKQINPVNMSMIN